MHSAACSLLPFPAGIEPKLSAHLRNHAFCHLELHVDWTRSWGSAACLLRCLHLVSRGRRDWPQTGPRIVGLCCYDKSSFIVGQASVARRAVACWRRRLGQCEDPRLVSIRKSRLSSAIRVRGRLLVYSLRANARGGFFPGRGHYSVGFFAEILTKSQDLFM